MSKPIYDQFTYADQSFIRVLRDLSWILRNVKGESGSEQYLHDVIESVMIRMGRQWEFNHETFKMMLQDVDRS